MSLGGSGVSIGGVRILRVGCIHESNRKVHLLKGTSTTYLYIQGGPPDPVVSRVISLHL